MKLRQGFVSNSSSSSFVIPLSLISQKDIDSIKNHIEIAKKHESYYDFDGVYEEDSWSIYEEEFYLTGSCTMDNFDMHTFLHKLLKIQPGIVKWGE